MKVETYTAAGELVSQIRSLEHYIAESRDDITFLPIGETALEQMRAIARADLERQLAEAKAKLEAL